MAVLLQATQEQLYRRDIQVFKELKITRTVDGVDYVSDPIPVEGRPALENEKQIQAARLTFNVPNPDGDYSIMKNSAINTVNGTFKPLLDDENKVVYREGLLGSDGTVQWFTRFTGKIKSRTDTGTGIEVVCEDMMCLMLDADAPEVAYTPSSSDAGKETLDRYAGDTDYSIYETDHRPISKSFPVVVYKQVGNDDEKEVDAGDYQIDHENGFVKFYDSQYDPPEIRQAGAVELSLVPGTYSYQVPEKTGVQRVIASNNSMSYWKTDDLVNYPVAITIYYSKRSKRGSSSSGSLIANASDYAFYTVDSRPCGITFNANPSLLLPAGMGITRIVASFYYYPAAVENVVIRCQYHYYSTDNYAEDVVIDLLRRGGFDRKVVTYTIAGTPDSIHIDEDPTQLISGEYFLSVTVNRVEKAYEITSGTPTDNRHFIYTPATNLLEFGGNLSDGDEVRIEYVDPSGTDLAESKSDITLWSYPRAEIYNGTSYAADRIFAYPNYPYENLKAVSAIKANGSTVSAANYEHDMRSGRIFFKVAVTAPITATYTAYTIKGTGVSSLPISFSLEEDEKAFNCLNKVRKVLAPNYIIRADADGKPIGHYSWQKGTPQIIEYGTDAAVGGASLPDQSLYVYALAMRDGSGNETLLSREIRVTTGLSATPGQNRNWFYLEPLPTGATLYVLYRREEGKEYAASSVVGTTAGTYITDTGAALSSGTPLDAPTLFVGYDHEITLFEDIEVRQGADVGEVYTHVVARGEELNLSVSNKMKTATITKLVDATEDSPSDGDLLNMKDGNKNTAAGWTWSDAPTYPVEFAKIALDGLYYLDSINLLSGAPGGRDYKSRPKLTILVSADDVTYQPLSLESGYEFEFVPNQWSEIKKDSFNYIDKVKYIKLRFDKDGRWERTVNLVGVDADYSVIVSEVRIFASEDKDNAGYIVKHAYSRPALLDKYGIRTKLLDADSLIYTDDKTQQRAYDVLRDVERAGNENTIPVIFAPYIDLEETIYVKDLRRGIEMLIYVDKLSTDQIIDTITGVDYNA